MTRHNQERRSEQMAMTTGKDRISTPVLSKLEKEDYSSKVDLMIHTSLSDAEALLSGVLADIDGYANSLINGINKIKDHNFNLEALGIFEDIFCCKYPSLSARLPSYNLSLNRKLDLSFNVTICGKTKSINPFDVAFQILNTINQYPGILHGDGEAILDALLANDLTSKMGLLGLGTALLTCVMDKSGGSITNQYSPFGCGASLTARNKLKDLLSKNKCARVIAKATGLYDTLASYNNSHFINMILDGDPRMASKYFCDMLGMSDISYKLGSIQSMLMGFGQSFNYSYSYNVSYSKIEILYGAWNSGLITPEYKSYLSADAKSILDALNQDENKNKDFDKINGTLGLLDPNWNKDEFGTTSYYRTIGNDVMGDLANNKLLSYIHNIIHIEISYNEELTGEVKKLFKSESEAVEYLLDELSLDDTKRDEVLVMLRTYYNSEKLLEDKYKITYYFQDDETLDLDGDYETHLLPEHHIAILQAMNG